MGHFLSSDDPNYEFSSILSLYLIFGGAVFGAGFLLLEYNGAQTTAPRLVSMKESLGIGFETEQSHTVTAEMSPPHLPMKVLSTPSMVQLIEATCLSGIAPHLDDSETSVGTHVNFSHVGPAHAGEEVVVKVRLSAINKRRLTFDVEVHSPRGVISTGTHERAVIDPSRLG